MHRSRKNILLAILLPLIVFLAGCQTTEGFGKDLQHVGKKIQKSAERHE